MSAPRQFRLLPTDRKAETNRSSLENERKIKPTYTSNVTTTPKHNLTDLDSVRQPNETESSLTETLNLTETSEVATPSPNYIYYRIYTDDGPIPSKAPVAPGYPLLGRIKARSVPPPRNAKAVKCRIIKVENIKDGERTSLFLTPYSQSPMGDSDMVTTANSILNRTSPGSMPQEPLALVAKMSDYERSALESDGRGGLASAAEADTRYVYYLLYADGDEMPSKVAFDPKEPSLGRIRVDSIVPPHSPTTIKQCISKVERTPELASAHADLFANTSCETPLKRPQISLLHTDGPGLSPNEPMAIVLIRPIPGPDGKYVIKNRAADIFWDGFTMSACHLMPTATVYFHCCTMEFAKNNDYLQWNITHDTNGNISMKSLFTGAPSSWVGADLIGSTVPVPWRLIQADSESYYLTTDMNRVSQNPQVPEAQPIKGFFKSLFESTPRLMAALKEGDQWQMWEFIRI